LHDYHVEVHKCRRLANVSHEDDYQVAADPAERDKSTVAYYKQNSLKKETAPDPWLNSSS